MQYDSCSETVEPRKAQYQFDQKNYQEGLMLQREEVNIEYRILSKIESGETQVAFVDIDWAEDQNADMTKRTWR